MSFTVYDDSRKCVKHWISLYDFPNLDYGSEELNSFARTLDVSWFATYIFPTGQGYSNQTRVYFRFEESDNEPWSVIQWYPKTNDNVVWMIKKGDKRGPVKSNIDYKAYAEFLYSQWTPSIMAKRFIPRLQQELERGKEREIKRKEEEYKNNPDMWSSKERIAEYKSLKRAIDPDYQYSDDARIFEYNSDLVDRLNRLCKYMTKEEINLAEK